MKIRIMVIYMEVNGQIVNGNRELRELRQGQETLSRGQQVSAIIQDRISDKEALISVRGQELRATFDVPLPASDHVKVEIQSREGQAAQVKLVEAVVREEADRIASNQQAGTSAGGQGISAAKIEQQVNQAMKESEQKPSPELREALKIVAEAGMTLSRETVREVSDFVNKKWTNEDFDAKYVRELNSSTNKLSTVEALVNKGIQPTNQQLTAIHETVHGSNLSETLQGLQAALGAGGATGAGSNVSYVDNELSQALGGIKTKDFLINIVTKRMADATNEFRDFRRELSNNLDNLTRLTANNNPQTSQVAMKLMEPTIQMLDKLLLKSDVLLFTDMKTEKILMKASSDMAKAKDLLESGNKSDALKLIRQVHDTIGRLNWQPSTTRIQRFVMDSQERIALMTNPATNHRASGGEVGQATRQVVQVAGQQIQNGPQGQASQALAQASQQYSLKVDGETTGRDVFNAVRNMGLNHESEAAQRLVSQNNQANQETKGNQQIPVNHSNQSQQAQSQQAQSQQANQTNQVNDRNTSQQIQTSQPSQQVQTGQQVQSSQQIQSSQQVNQPAVDSRGVAESRAFFSHLPAEQRQALETVLTKFITEMKLMTLDSSSQRPEVTARQDVNQVARTTQQAQPVQQPQQTQQTQTSQQMPVAQATQQSQAVQPQVTESQTQAAQVQFAKQLETLVTSIRNNETFLPSVAQLERTIAMEPRAALREIEGLQQQVKLESLKLPDQARAETLEANKQVNNLTAVNRENISNLTSDQRVVLETVMNRLMAEAREIASRPAVDNAPVRQLTPAQEQVSRVSQELVQATKNNENLAAAIKALEKAVRQSPEVTRPAELEKLAQLVKLVQPATIEKINESSKNIDRQVQTASQDVSKSMPQQAAQNIKTEVAETAKAQVVARLITVEPSEINRAISNSSPVTPASTTSPTSSTPSTFLTSSVTNETASKGESVAANTAANVSREVAEIIRNLPTSVSLDKVEPASRQVVENTISRLTSELQMLNLGRDQAAQQQPTQQVTQTQQAINVQQTQQTQQTQVQTQVQAQAQTQVQTEITNQLSKLVTDIKSNQPIGLNLLNLRSLMTAEPNFMAQLLEGLKAMQSLVTAERIGLPVSQLDQVMNQIMAKLDVFAESASGKGQASTVSLANQPVSDNPARPVSSASPAGATNSAGPVMREPLANIPLNLGLSMARGLANSQVTSSQVTNSQMTSSQTANSQASSQMSSQIDPRISTMTVATASMTSQANFTMASNIFNSQATSQMSSQVASQQVTSSTMLQIQTQLGQMTSDQRVVLDTVMDRLHTEARTTLVNQENQAANQAAGQTSRPEASQVASPGSTAASQQSQMAPASPAAPAALNQTSSQQELNSLIDKLQQAVRDNQDVRPILRQMQANLSQNSQNNQNSQNSDQMDKFQQLSKLFDKSTWDKLDSMSKAIDRNLDRAQANISNNLNNHPNQNLKSQLLEMIRQDQGRAASQQAEQTLNQVTGQQLLSKFDHQSNLQSMFMSIPVVFKDQLEDLKVFVNGNSKSEKIDWENASIYFLLDTQRLGTTGIQISATNRNLSVTIKNDRPGIQRLFEPMLDTFREKLEEIGYNTQGVKFGPLTDPNEKRQGLGQAVPTEDKDKEEDKGKVRYNPYQQKGFDFKI